MNSLNQLLQIMLVLYLGIFTYLIYQIIFYNQHKFLFIKHLLFFYFISKIWINISSKYYLDFKIIFIIIYILGIFISTYILSTYIEKLNIDFYNMFYYEVRYLIILLIVPPILYIIRRNIYKYIYYIKHPWLKPIGIKRLF